MNKLINKNVARSQWQAICLVPSCAQRHLEHVEKSRSIVLDCRRAWFGCGFQGLGTSWRRRKTFHRDDSCFLCGFGWHCQREFSSQLFEWDSIARSAMLLRLSNCHGKHSLGSLVPIDWYLGQRPNSQEVSLWWSSEYREHSQKGRLGTSVDLSRSSKLWGAPRRLCLCRRHIVFKCLCKHFLPEKAWTDGPRSWQIEWAHCAWRGSSPWLCLPLVFQIDFRREAFGWAHWGHCWRVCRSGMLFCARGVACQLNWNECNDDARLGPLCRGCAPYGFGPSQEIQHWIVSFWVDGTNFASRQNKFLRESRDGIGRGKCRKLRRVASIYVGRRLLMDFHSMDFQCDWTFVGSRIWTRAGGMSIRFIRCIGALCKFTDGRHLKHAGTWTGFPGIDVHIQDKIFNLGIQALFLHQLI